MNTEIDWPSELDAAVVAAPDRPVESYVRAGRGALLRRRAAATVSGVATAAVVGGLVWSVAPGDGALRPDAPVTTHGTPSPTAEESAAPPTPGPSVAPLATRPEDVREAGPAQAELFEGPTIPVTALVDGGLVHQAGWEVEAIYVLADKGVRKRVWGVSAVPSAGGDAIWMLVSWRPGRVGATADPEGKAFAVFEDWLDATWAEQLGEEPPQVARTVGGQLSVAAGVEVLETVPHPRQAAAYGPVD